MLLCNILNVWFQKHYSCFLCLRKLNPCRVKITIWHKQVNIKKSLSFLTLRFLWKQLSSKWWWQTNTFSSFSKCLRFNFEIQIFFWLGSLGSLKKLNLSSFCLLELLVQSIAAQWTMLKLLSKTFKRSF